MAAIDKGEILPTRAVWLSAEADRRDEWNPRLSPKREHVREEGTDVCDC